MIRWTGLAPWEFESPFPGSLTSNFLVSGRTTYAGLSWIQRNRFRAKRELLDRFSGLLPESQGQNLPVTVLYVPYSLDRRITRVRATTVD